MSGFSLILKFVPAKPVKYKMKPVGDLSPEVQQLIGFAKPVAMNDSGINGEAAREEYLSEKFRP